MSTYDINKTYFATKKFSQGIEYLVLYYADSSVVGSDGKFYRVFNIIHSTGPSIGAVKEFDLNNVTSSSDVISGMNNGSDLLDTIPKDKQFNERDLLRTLNTSLISYMLSIDSNKLN